MTATLPVDGLRGYAAQSPLGWLAYRSPATTTHEGADFHVDLTALPAPGEKQARVVFRSAAKTTLANALALWAIDTDQTGAILIVRATGTDAADTLDDLDELAVRAGMSTRMRRADHLLIVNDRPIWARAPGMATRGINYRTTDGRVLRPQLIIIDDVEDDDTARSVTQTNRIQRYITRTAIPTAFTALPAAVIMFGTPLSPISLIAKAMRRETPFDTWLDPLVVPYEVDGVPSWPATYNPQLEAQTDDDTYATEYQLNPLPPTSLIFPPARTVWMPEAEMPRLRCKVGVDPATGDMSEKKRQDRTGIVATGLGPAGIYVPAAECWHGAGDDVPSRVAALVRHLQTLGHVVESVTVEAVGGFVFVAKHVATEVAPIPVVYGKPKTSKLERAQELNRWHKAGQLVIAAELRGSELDVETHTWTRQGVTATGHDDMPDALVWSARATTDRWTVQPAVTANVA